MPDFSKRNEQKEWLDGDAIPFEDIRLNMQELDAINHRLGGHAITLKGIQTLLQNALGQESFHIVEIGCGGGDNLRVIKNWGNKQGFNLQLTGIDINPECIRFAQSRDKHAGIEFICADYAKKVFDGKPHLIFSSLFCHHFSHKALVAQMRWMQQNSRLGFFINDLQRHPIAYRSIQLLTRIFSRSYLVKHDAPLSVLRGFSREEWTVIFAAAGITHYSISWRWAFRWLIIVRV